MSVAALPPDAAPATVPSPRFRPELALGVLAFFLSGAAGLVYQVSWQRILALHSGVGIYSIAMIVGAFMAGIGVGSLAGGMFSQRTGPRSALRAFVAIELAIGAFGALSCWLYYDLLYLKASWMYTPAWRAGLLHFAGLFLPTFLMGTSLPFLVRAMLLDARTAGRTIGLLYGVNILGAAIGSVLTPWLLIRFWGIRGAVFAAAAANVVAGLLALAALWFVPKGAGVAEAAPLPAPETGGGARRHPFALWVGLYALSGFVALSLEILWFRIMEMAVKSTAFTFGTLLGYYLLGSAIGCLLGAPFVARMRRPLRVFLWLQCVILAYAVVSVIALAYTRPDFPFYEWYMGYWGKGWFTLGSHWDPVRFRWLYVYLPVALLALPTILMGLSFPTLQRAVHDDVRTSGRKVGILQAANIAGCVAGSLAVGLLALDLLGTTGTFRVLALVGVGFALVGWRLESRWFAAAAALLAALAVLAPGQRAFWLRLHGEAAESTSIMEEDASGVGALVESQRQPGRWAVFVHGKSHSWIPFGGIHTNLGAAPALMHPNPVDVAVIGLGSGDTAWAAGVRPETRSITVFEISGPQPRILRALADRSGNPELKSILDDPRLRIRAADGRNALEQEGRLYDIIEADALWPPAPYSGNLYSVEFFQQCLRLLKPGGMVVSWAPTGRVYFSLATASPYTLGLADRSILIGSNEPIELHKELWLERARSPQTVAYLGERGADGVGGLLDGLQQLNRKRRRHNFRDMNFDLFPRDEFATPRGY